MSERVRVTPGNGQQVKAPVPRDILTPPNHQETNVQGVTGSFRNHNHIRLWMKRKARNTEINRYRLFYRLDAPRVGWKSEELNLRFHGDAIHATRSGLPPDIGQCVRRCLTPIDVNVRPSRTILLKSLDAIGDSDAGRPIGLQPSGIEVEFVLDPERVTNEVAETAVYLQEAWYSTSDIYITLTCFSLRTSGTGSLSKIFSRSSQGRFSNLLVSVVPMTVEGYAEMVAGGQVPVDSTCRKGPLVFGIPRCCRAVAIVGIWVNIQNNAVG